MSSDFNWNDLRSFLAVARAGRLTVAARKLRIDHSTLSRRIMSLEQALGVKLFERRSMGYTLTVAGEELLSEAEDMESLAIRMHGRVTGPNLGVSGTVRIGSPEGFATFFLAPHLSDLSGAHPDLEVELVAMPRAFSLSKREADVAVTMSCPEHGRLIARKLTDYELGVYAAAAYLAEHDPIRSVDDLLQHRMIGYIEDLMAFPELDYLDQVAKRLSPQTRISNIITQAAATVGGAGVGILPCFIAEQEPSLVRLFSDQIKIVRSYWLVTHDDIADLARIRKAMDFIIDTVRANRDAFWAAPVEEARNSGAAPDRATT